MQVKNINVQELLNRLRIYFQESDVTGKIANEQLPLRAELYNTTQLEHHGMYLAGIHKLKSGNTKDTLLTRLAKNEKILIEVRNLLTEAIKEDQVISPAGEWLLDNFYLIEDHISTGKRHLPKGYSEGLPHLINSSSEIVPRVYDIAIELMAHSDGRIDIESLKIFVTAYQKKTSLLLGELWAIPIMLRLALIENLRRVAARVAKDRVNRNLAEYWSALMKETAAKDPKNLILIIADMARSAPPLESSFVAEMVRQLMWMGPGLSLPLTWMEQRLSETGLTSNELVNAENQKQAADQVSISNSISTLRLLGSVEWHKFVEEISIVEQTLIKEISGIYSKLDFSTRDYYRHIIEKIAKNSNFSENEVAASAVHMADLYEAGNDPDIGKNHVGFYLAGPGRVQTEMLAGAHLLFGDRMQKTIKKFPLIFYLGSVFLITSLVSWFLIDKFIHDGINRWLIFFASLVTLIGVSQFSIVLTNWLVTLIVKPELLPRMDFSTGIPKKFTTLVVVPSILTSIKHAESLLEALEVRYLANKDEHLHFGLLTDFPDAVTEVCPEDGNVLFLVQKGIEDLNEKYGGIRCRFYLFHRPRKWNPCDKRWMGYERKRGKLNELNLLLLEKKRENFLIITGNLDDLDEVKYIITLDTDTRLPRDAGWKLTAAMAHPLNRPCFDDHMHRVVTGYAILQPRVAVCLTTTKNSYYSQIHGNEPGIDPYTRLTSDVYQDLFNEGSFIGKGIYDIAAFAAVNTNRFPENRILSHDLLEGCYGRSGLISDIQLYEEYPLSYNADVNRRHRWIRGDWQIGYWALPFAPIASGKLERNPISTLSRWKIFDNLRRSLVPGSLTFLLLSGWTFLHQSMFWSIIVVTLVMLPSLAASLLSVIRKPKDISLWHHIVFSSRTLTDSIIQNTFLFISLPYEAYYSLDAIVRTGWRMLISRRNLLEWNPSHNHVQTSDGSIASAWRVMWPCTLIAIIVFIFIFLFSPNSSFAAFPILLLWAIFPFIAWQISKPTPEYEINLTAEQSLYLRKTARKIWSFFEQFTGPDDNWLPPDNYQEQPDKIVAHRTSPTNIGLALLANLSAFDFGFITADAMIKSSLNTMNTMKLLERYQGHFYNWYDTLTLKPLAPKYVSTVDSGNLSGHLLVFRQGLLELPRTPIINLQLFNGLLDTVNIIEQVEPLNAPLKLLRNYLKTITGLSIPTRENIKPITDKLKNYSSSVLESLYSQPESEAYWWANSMVAQSGNISNYTDQLLAWVRTVEIPQKFMQLYQSAQAITLEQLSSLQLNLSKEIELLKKQKCSPSENEWLDSFSADIIRASAFATEMTETAIRMAEMCINFADSDFGILYDKSKHLFSIGYNADDHRLDAGFYDLLASEASLCNFVAIALGKIPQESWFAQGRLLTVAGGKPILLSWSGSMFEYLMPLLVMPDYKNTLIHQTRSAVVARQIEYGLERNVPWGISESGYNLMDANLNYQYQAFGVPGLGLKRGLSDNLVIAPYASVLAVMIDPIAACRNMEILTDQGFEGRYGFYEAIDYTVSRLPKGQQYAVVQSFMSHHQAMSLLSLAYALLGQPMQKRFGSELQFQATLMLLQERIPKTKTYYSHATDISVVVTEVAESGIRVINTPNTPIPEIQLLSNGMYHVMITNAGGGYSRWKDLSITRWREDTTCDNWGTFCYIRDCDDGSFWSNTWQPTLKQARKYEAAFTQGKAEFRRVDNNIEAYTELVVSPEDDMEMRRIHLTNHSRKSRTIELTSYSEVVLATGVADNLHPAFSNLFIQTEIIDQRNAIICSRRPRSVEDKAPYMFHIMSCLGVNCEKISYETDRNKFIGRGKSVVSPEVMNRIGPLSNSQGPVLDPVASIRFQINLDPDETAVIDMITGVSETSNGCRSLIEKYQDKHHKDRVFELAWTHSQVLLRQINATESDAQGYGQLSGSVIYSNPQLRADASIIIKNQRGQSGLWAYSVSGDLPVVLVEIEDQANIELVKQMVQAHAYWRQKGLATDLVIINEDRGGYRQILQNLILGLIATSAGNELTDRPGAIFVRSADQISAEDRILFQAVARIMISDKKGNLSDFITRKNALKNNISHITLRSHLFHQESDLPIPEGLLYFNGIGGFVPGGKEYCIISKNGELPPAPWINVLANPVFGTLISDCGQSYTWSENAHEFRISPWENDPVSDRSGEAFYIRDEDSGYFWSPTPLPAGKSSKYIIRHGFGFSVFEHIDDGIYSEMQVFVDLEDQIKFVTMKLINHSGRQRRISVTGFIELVLGDLKSKTAMHILSEYDVKSSTLFAKNPYNKEFDGRVAFFDLDDPAKSYTTDRCEFIGRNGTLKHPDAMTRTRLAGKTGTLSDPCMAIQSSFFLAVDQERELVFRLGMGKDVEEARKTVLKYKGVHSAHESLKKVKKYWEQTLGVLQINTPNLSLNLLTNGWLLYQTIACRLWARSGFYQSGGAFGFRDQLQDVLAIVHTQPVLARNQILLCASRQFIEGDVQHWWHPPSGRGVRTRCSDDLLWLPYVTATFILKTGDTGILEENVPFLSGRNLSSEENSVYELPAKSEEIASIYQHCKMAIEHSLKFGENGLPLIGSGDWNDGMDMVGVKGKGESVWLGFFLYDVLMQFIPVTKLKNDNTFGEKCMQTANLLKSGIDKKGWDGEWYLRAYFDDGKPLGSKLNEECKIDSISQSWAVISGAGDLNKRGKALDSAYKMLVKENVKLVSLLNPPFDHSSLNPGYIKGYLPGIRENGGQYTHAAIWLIMAYAISGNAKRAWELVDMINPVNHGDSPEAISIYKTEPYVIAADVYSVVPNAGRGGWTWYSGSAGWMYQLIVYWLIGIKIEGETLYLIPCIPSEWDACNISYCFRETQYQIILKQNDRYKSRTVILLDGIEQDDIKVALVNDGVVHNIEMWIASNAGHSQMD